MKHKGKATNAGLKIILVTLLGLIAVVAAGLLATFIGWLVAWIFSGLVALWVLFALFTLYFFRDPTPRVPAEARAVVSPAYGTVDIIDEVEEPLVMGGRCKRVSIFLSVVDVHVQYAPVAGKVVFQRHTPGKFLNALSADSCLHNENVLIGFDSTEKPGDKMAIRLIAGLIARRIVPWIQEGESVPKGERISMIQFGSRCDVYLPISAQVTVALGAKVRGGETIIAQRA